MLPLAQMNRQNGVEHGNSVEIAFHHVRDLIVRGRLAPGSWILFVAPCKGYSARATSLNIRAS